MSFAVVGEKPLDSECTFIGDFKRADKSAEYVGMFSRYNARLAADRIWLSKDLCIPLAAVKSTELITKGFILPRRALRIAFINPISNSMDEAFICDTNIIGYYRLTRLERLRVAIRIALDALPDEPRPGTRPVEAPEAGFLLRLFGSRKTLERIFCLQMIQSLEPTAILPQMSFEEACDVLTHLRLKRKGNSEHADLKQTLSKLVVSNRILAVWHLILLTVPAMLAAQWRLAIPIVWTVKGVLDVSLSLLIYYVIFAFVVLIIGVALNRPVIWLVNTLLGTHINIKKGR